jgi:predicted RNA-binding protein with PUA-like domain
MPRYWLLKSEADSFSFDDLLSAPARTTHWDGVRNYQARNLLRDDVRKGDLAFFYHSNSDPTAIVGIVEVVRGGYPDHTAFDPHSEHFDPKSDPDSPTWFMVDVRAKSKLKRPVTLAELRATSGLEKMVLLQKGSRLSVQPVTAREWMVITKRAEEPAAEGTERKKRRR